MAPVEQEAPMIQAAPDAEEEAMIRAAPDGLSALLTQAAPDAEAAVPAPVLLAWPRLVPELAQPVALDAVARGAVAREPGSFSALALEPRWHWKR